MVKLLLFASSSNCFLPQRYQKTRLDWIRIQWSILPSQTSGRWTTTTPGLSLTEDKYSKPPSEVRQMIINWCSSLGSVGSVGSMSSPETYGKDPLSPSTSQTRFQITDIRYRAHWLNKYYFNRLAFWFVAPSRAPASQCPHCLREFTNLRHHINQQHMQVKNGYF